MTRTSRVAAAAAQPDLDPPNRAARRAASRAAGRGRVGRGGTTGALLPRLDGSTTTTAESAARAAARVAVRSAAAGPVLVGPGTGRTIAAPAARDAPLLPGPGSPMPGHVVDALAPPGAAMPDVRYHADARAGRLTGLLGARAVTIGADVLFAPGRFDPFSPVGQGLIAHELRHVADQTRAGAVRVQAAPEEVLQSTVSPDEVAGYSDEDLATAVDLLVGQLQALERTDLLRSAAIDNMFTVGMEADDRGLECAQTAWQALRDEGGDLAAPSLVADLEAEIDLARAMLTRTFTDDATAMPVERLDRWRSRLPFLPAGAAGPMQQRVHTTATVVDELAQLKGVTPQEAPPAPTDLDDPVALTLTTAVRTTTQNLIAALAAAVPAVASGLQDSMHRATRTAQEAYFDAFTSSFLYSVERARDTLPTGADIPHSDYLSTLDVSPNRWYGHDAEWTRFLDHSATVGQELADLAIPAGAWAGSTQDRARLLVEKGDAAHAALQRAQPLQLAYGALAYSALVRYETYRRYQMHQGDAELDGAFRVIAQRALDMLDSPDAPPERELVRLQGRLTTRIAEARERFDQLETLDAGIEWIANIASIVVGVGVMRLGLAALAARGTWLAGRALAPSVARFVVGSLLFTAGSTAGRVAFTGRVPTGTELATQTGLDLVTLGIARGAHILVGARYALAGTRLTTEGLVRGMAAAPTVAVHSATFASMWAWAATLALVTTEGDLDPSTALTTIARTGVRTAIDLVVLHYAGRLFTAPAAPTTGLDAHVSRQWSALRAEARDVGERMRVWLRSAERDPVVFERMATESESVLLRMREVMGRMFELTDPQRAQLDRLFAEQLELVESMRQGVQLGVEQVGEGVWRYRGSVEQLETFLGRLRRGGTVESYARARGGVVEVVFADGRVAFFAPRGGPSPVVDARTATDTTSAAVRTAAPTVPDATRADAVLALRLLPPGEGARVAGALGPPGSSAMVSWLAQPDVAPLLRGPDPFATGERLRDLVADLDAGILVRAMRPADLEAWWSVRPTPDMTTRAFVDHLRGLQAFRGSLVLDDPTVAAAEAARFGRSVEGRELRVPVPSTYTGPTIGPMPRAGSPTVTSTSFAERIGEHLAAAGFAGEVMTELRVDSRTWVVRMQAGRPVRAWQFDEGLRLVAQDVDLETTVETIRRAVEDAESLAQVDRVRATERLGRVRSTVENLEALRRSRAEALRDLRDLLERAQPDRFAPPVPFVGPVWGPVTRAESLGQRRDAAVARAARMGLPRDAARAPSASARAAVTAVEALRARNPRGASVRETLDAIEAEAGAAERALDRLATEALDRAVERFGGDVVTRVRRGSLARLSDVEIGETIEALRGLRLAEPGATPEAAEGALRGLLHAAHPPPGVRAVPLDRIVERAPSAAERNRALDTFGRLVDAEIPGAHEVLRAMVSSRNAWRGGVFALDTVRYHTGTADVLGLEVRQAAPDPGGGREMVRIFDIVRRSAGTTPADLQTVELKDWSRWFEETIRSRTGADGRSQFERDVLLRTADLTDVSGLRRLRWLFRGPGPAIEGTTNPLEVYRHIRSVMRDALDQLAAERSLTAEERADLLNEFDLYTRMIEIIEIEPTRTAKPVRRLAPDPEPP